MFVPFILNEKSQYLRKNCVYKRHNLRQEKLFVLLNIQNIIELQNFTTLTPEKNGNGLIQV